MKVVILQNIFVDQELVLAILEVREVLTPLRDEGLPSLPSSSIFTYDTNYDQIPSYSTNN